MDELVICSICGGGYKPLFPRELLDGKKCGQGSGCSIFVTRKGTKWFVRGEYGSRLYDTSYARIDTRMVKRWNLSRGSVICDRCFQKKIYPKLLSEGYDCGIHDDNTRGKLKPPKSLYRLCIKHFLFGYDDLREIGLPPHAIDDIIRLRKSLDNHFNRGALVAGSYKSGDWCRYGIEIGKAYDDAVCKYRESRFIKINHQLLLRNGRRLSVGSNCVSMFGYHKFMFDLERNPGISSYDDLVSRSKSP